MRKAIGTALLTTLVLAGCTKPTYNTVCTNAGHSPGTPAFEQCLKDKHAEHVAWVDSIGYGSIGGGGR